MSREQSAKTILILAANPQGTVPLRLDEEVHEIKAGLRRSRHRDRFRVQYESALVRVMSTSSCWITNRKWCILVDMVKEIKD